MLTHAWLDILITFSNRSKSMSVITLLLHYFAQIDIRKCKSMDGFKLNCYFDILTNFHRENTICYCNSLLWSLYFSDNTEFSCYVVNNVDFSSLLLKVNYMIGNTWKYLKNQITWMSWNIYQLYWAEVDITAGRICL